MQLTKNLSCALRSLVALLEEEAAKNPDFARRLDLLMSELPAPSKKFSKPKAPDPDMPIPDVFGAFEAKGEAEFPFWLRDFNITMLKSIVKVNGFDPGKISQRWSDPDKFVSLIVEQMVARLKRGSMFLPPKSSDEASVEPHNE